MLNSFFIQGHQVCETLETGTKPHHTTPSLSFGELLFLLDTTSPSSILARLIAHIQLVKNLFAYPRKDTLFHYLLFNQSSWATQTAIKRKNIVSSFHSIHTNFSNLVLAVLWELHIKCLKISRRKIIRPLYKRCSLYDEVNNILSA